jgi:hypothetical protein
MSLDKKADRKEKKSMLSLEYRQTDKQKEIN